MLNDVDKTEFDKVWACVLEIGEQERHFNNLQTVYRTMASTWLLSSFAAMGYVLAKEFTPAASREILIAAVGALSTLGIVLLWILDARVYQQLLGACFVEGYVLENEHRWLPPVRHNMWKTQNNVGVLSRVVGFYVAPAVLLTAISSSSAAVWVWRADSSGGALCLLLGLAAACWIGVAMRRKSALSEPLSERIENSDNARPSPAGV